MPKRGADSTEATPKSKRVRASAVESPAATPTPARITRSATKVTVSAATTPLKPALVVEEEVTEEVETEFSKTSASAKKDIPIIKTKAKLTAAEAEKESPAVASPSKTKSTSKKQNVSKTKVEAAEAGAGVEAGEAVGGKEEKAETKATGVKQKRKSKEEKAAEMVPLAARTKGLKMFIGAHVSAAGGVQNALQNATHIGANSLALFLKSQRKWDNPPLQAPHRTAFIEGCKSHSYEAAKHVLPHGSYLVNLAQAEPVKATQALHSFVDDLERCEQLGIQLYNFHPGNTNGTPRPEAIARLADSLNRAHEKVPGKTVAVLETMAAAGNCIGGAFEDLRDVIALVTDKTRVGVCIDTCHIFAAGYDLRTPETFSETLSKFDEIIGMQYLRALHLNDSKAPLSSKRDLHANIGTGYLGLRAFWNVMNETRFEGLPLVLETPIDKKDANGKVIEDKSVWAREVKLLESLIGMDVEGGDFKKLEAELNELGKGERERVGDQVGRKVEKEKKALAKGGKARGRKKTKAESDEEDGESE